MEPVNIIVALPNDTLGGAEQYLKMVAHQFVKRQCNVYVLFLKKQNDNGWHDLSVSDNIHLKYTDASSEKKGMWSFIGQLLSLRKLRFEYVFTSHVHLTGIVGLFIRLGLLKKKYFIGRESTSIFRRFTGFKLMMFKLQYWMGYSALDLLICQTHFMKKQLVEALPNITRKLKIEVIPNPIDLDAMIAGVMADDEQRRYGNYIVSAGRMIPEKGFDILIPAFAEVKRVYPDLKLLILGEGKDRAALESMIANLGLENDVFLPGFTKDVYTYFKHAGLCVISSRIEGFPNVLLQMMSQHNKVVSTTCAGGIADMPGIVISDTHSEKSLKNAILTALKTDSEENRYLFDAQLKERSIDKFIDKIRQHVS